jgi:hypothetical protein
MKMKPAARIAAFKFRFSAKSAAALRNSKKVLIRLLDLAGAVRRPSPWIVVTEQRAGDA